MTTTLTERTYGIDFTDKHGPGYVQRDAVSAAAAVRRVGQDYASAVIERVEVVYSPPAS